MEKQQLSSLHHCVFALHYHLVLVTKYRQKVIDEKMMKRFREIFTETLEKWECSLIEFNGEPDHVHLLLTMTPAIQPSKLINNLKTVSSRLIRKEFAVHVKKFYWNPVFWHRSYCLMTTGGAPIDVIKKYIEEQGAHEDAS